MKVKLIQVTQNPIDVMWTAARTCYSAKSPIEIWEDTIKQQCFQKLKDSCSGYEEKDEVNQKHWNLVKKVLDSGHAGIAETVVFTFSIEGVSRSLTHQLVRHRLACYSQQSQRYVNFKDKTFEYVIPDTITKNNKAEIIYNEFMLKCKEYYDRLIDMDIPAEDARYVFPNAACTNINMTVNLRELIHISNLRLCNRASKEIRDLFKLIKQEVVKVDERLGNLLVPSCEASHGICFEDKCCGRKPSIKDIMNKVTQENDNGLTRVDMELLLKSIENPEVNEKLRELLQKKVNIGELKMYDYRNDIIEKQAEIIKSLQEELLERAEYELSLLKTLANWERHDTENKVIVENKALAELETKSTNNKIKNYSELQKEFEEFTQLTESEKNV